MRCWDIGVMADSEAQCLATSATHAIAFYCRTTELRGRNDTEENPRYQRHRRCVILRNTIEKSTKEMLALPEKALRFHSLAVLAPMES